MLWTITQGYTREVAYNGTRTTQVEAGSLEEARRLFLEDRDNLDWELGEEELTADASDWDWDQPEFSRE
jgi:hypothetical protein